MCGIRTTANCSPELKLGSLYIERSCTIRRMIRRIKMYLVAESSGVEGVVRYISLWSIDGPETNTVDH
jgi:hypothetical protein